MHNVHKSIACFVAAVALAVGLVPAVQASETAPPSTSPSALSTPELIDAAVAAHRIDRATGDLYLAWALGPDWRKVPAEYQSRVPWEGTVPALHLRDRVKAMPRGAKRSAIAEAQSPQGVSVGHSCYAFATPTLNSVQSPHFFVEYTAPAIGGGLTIDDYVESFETSWATEVDEFGWAAPPVLPSTPPPGGTYHVRIEPLGPALYGLATTLGSHAGDVGDNPDTAWDDTDAAASCIVVNSDFSGFPGTPQAALDATTAHEFNHAIQYGYGALSGDNIPDDVFVEGGATWMEDEVMDAANDSYNYLWPNFRGSMGEYADSPYPYFITFRGLTERYGAGVPGGGEQVMQDFWEETSRNEGDNLTAMQTALANKGTTLAAAYHDYAVAVRLSRSCGGGYVLPYCFEEGDDYVAFAGPNTSDGAIGAVGGSFGSTVEDGYALSWVDLPISGPGEDFSLTLANTSAGGALRGSVVCDTGSGLAVTHLPSVVDSGQSTSLPFAITHGCTAAFVAITNEAQTAPNPSETVARSYTLTTAAPPAGPSVSIRDVTVTEPAPGKTQTMAFRIELSARSAFPVTVSFSAANGSAIAGADYRMPAGSITIAPGRRVGTVHAKARGDVLVEGDETFTVTIANAVGGTIVRPTATGTIHDRV